MNGCRIPVKNSPGGSCYRFYSDKLVSYDPGSYVFKIKSLAPRKKMLYKMRFDPPSK